MTTFGSLFAGIGGMDLGLERAGWTCAWQVEIDPYATQVLARHWPAVPRFRDVREVGAAQLTPVDLIAGGFPCQDISTAGKGAGLAGSRSGLWSEYLRIIRELRPRLVLVENVPALRSRGLGTVLGQLAESGYDAEWDCIPAAALGAPHRRDRIFVVAYPSSGELREQPGWGGGTHRARAAEPADHGAAGDVADAKRERCWFGAKEARRKARCSAPGLHRPASDADVADPNSSAGIASGIAVRSARREPLRGGPKEPRRCGDDRVLSGVIERGGWWSAEPDVGRVAHGVPRRVDRLRCLGNAVVPQVAEWLGRQLIASMGPS